MAGRLREVATLVARLSMVLGGDYVGAMSDEPLTNAAVDSARRPVKLLNSVTRESPTPTLGDGMPRDFEFEDRRSGGVNFGKLEISEYGARLKSHWELGSGQPRWAPWGTNTSNPAQ